MRRLHLPIAEPCHENWDAMTPVEGGRHCASCVKEVHDLTDLSQSELTRFMRDNQGKRICVRYRPAADGAVRVRHEAPAALARSVSSRAGATLTSTGPTRAALPRVASWLSTAGLAASLLSGCTEGFTRPTNIDETHCNYELGPYSFRLRRGEGQCPAPEEPCNTGRNSFVMGDVAIEEPPLMGEPMPIPNEPPLMGAVPVETPAVRDPVPEMGEVEVQPDPEPRLMGKVALPPEPAIKGDVKVPAIKAPPPPLDPIGE